MNQTKRVHWAGWLLAGWVGLAACARAEPAPPNMPPAFSGLDGDSVTHAEAGAATLLDQNSDATLADADSADFAGGNVTVTITTNRVDTEDRVELRHQGNGTGQIGVSGSDVAYEGTIIGTFTGGSGANPLVVTLNASSTVSAVQALVRALTYTNSNHANPSPATRQVSVALDDGDGGTATAVVSVQVTALNDAPTLSVPPNFISFASDHLPLFGITAADVDASNAVVTATMSAAMGTFTATNAGGVSIAGSGTGLLEMTGTFPALNAFIGATNIVFAVPAGATNDIVLSVAVNDDGNTGADPGLSGDNSSEAALETIPILVLPVVLSVGVPPSGLYAAGQSLDFLVNVSEPVLVDTNGGVPRLVLDIGGNSRSAFYAGGSRTNILTFRYPVQLADQDADGIGVGANLDLNGAVIQDSSSNNVPTVLLNLGSTIGVLVNGPAPAAIPDTFTAAEDAVLNGNVLLNDLDGNGDPITAILVTGPTNGLVTLSTNGTFVYSPATNVNGGDSFTYKVNDGTLDSSPGLVTITITPVNDAPEVTAPLVDQTVTYGSTNFSYTFGPTVFTDLDGDTLTYIASGLPGGVTFTSTNRTFSGAPTVVGSNQVRVVGFDGQIGVTNTFNLFVTKATLVAVADDKTRVYGVTNPLLTITYTGFAGADTAAGLTNPPVASTLATNKSPVGSYVIALTNGADHRYSLVLSNGTLTIGQATVVASPISKSKAFGEPNPPLTITYLGLAEGETETVLDVPPTASTTAVQSSPPGTYPITLTGGSDANYNLVLRDGTLVVRSTGVPPAGGTYYGLFYETGGVQTNSSGALTLQTAAGSSFSALVRMEGKSYRFTGTFDALGRFTNELIRVGFFPITIELEIGSTNSPFQLSGRVMLSGGGWESPLLAARAIYHATSNPAPQAGRYSMFWPGGTNIFVGEPFGHSHAAVKVSSNGKVNLQAQLADNTTTAEAMVLTEGGVWPCYVPMRKRDALLGWLTFTNLPTQDIAGRVTWTSWPVPNRLLYPLGFRTERSVYGSRYTPPTGVTNRIINLNQGDFITTVADVFFLPGIIQDKITNVVILGEDHRFTTTNGFTLPVRVRPQSGLFSGHILDPVLGSVYRFTGSLIQKTNVGVGFHSGRFASGRVEYVPSP